MILRRYSNGSRAGMGQGLLVLKHRAEIATVKIATACFTFEK